MKLKFDEDRVQDFVDCGAKLNNFWLWDLEFVLSL